MSYASPVDTDGNIEAPNLSGTNMGDQFATLFRQIVGFQQRSEREQTVFKDKATYFFYLGVPGIPVDFLIKTIFVNFNCLEQMIGDGWAEIAIYRSKGMNPPNLSVPELTFLGYADLLVHGNIPLGPGQAKVTINPGDILPTDELWVAVASYGGTSPAQFEAGI